MVDDLGRSDQAAELRALRVELAAAQAEIGRLRGLLGLDREVPTAVPEGQLFAPEQPEPPPAGEQVDRSSAPEAKLALFRRLFAARSDVYALRWENASSGKAGWMPARRGGRDGPTLPLTDEVLRRHLEGHEHVGVYPLRQGDTTTLLA